MPYTYRKENGKYCVYNKETGKKRGCTKGTREAVNRYLAALHINEKKGRSLNVHA